MGDTPRRPQAPGPSANALRGRPDAEVGETVTLLNPENERTFVYEVSKLTDAIADQIRLGKLEVVHGEFPDGTLDPIANPAPPSPPESEVDPADDESQDDDGGGSSDDGQGSDAGTGDDGNGSEPALEPDENEPPAPTDTEPDPPADAIELSGSTGEGEADTAGADAGVPASEVD